LAFKLALNKILSNDYFRDTQTGYFFGSQVQSLAGFPQPEQTLSLIGLPHFLHGEHPHV